MDYKHFFSGNYLELDSIMGLVDAARGTSLDGPWVYYLLAQCGLPHALKTRHMILISLQ